MSDDRRKELEPRVTQANTPMKNTPSKSSKQSARLQRIASVKSLYATYFSETAVAYETLLQSGQHGWHSELCSTLTHRYPTVLVLQEYSNYTTRLSFLPKPMNFTEVMDSGMLDALERAITEKTHYPPMRELAAFLSGYMLGEKHGRAQVRDNQDPQALSVLRPYTLGLRG